MSMAWLCLTAYTVFLVGCFHTAVTESDVTPRLTFSYSKLYTVWNVFHYLVPSFSGACMSQSHLAVIYQ